MWCVLRDCIDAGYPKRHRLVASEQPCGAFYVEHDCVTTGAGGMNADGFYVAQRAEDMGLKEVGMTEKGLSERACRDSTEKMTHSESSVLPPRSLRPNFGLRQYQQLEITQPRDAAWTRTSRFPPRSELGESLSVGSEIRYKGIYVPLPHFCVPRLPLEVCA
jgi:hypothetical protein